MPKKRLKHRAFKGDNGKWGVEDTVGATLYEADFTRKQAVRLAELQDDPRPPKDWEAARKVLEDEGLIKRRP